ncbi:hypothetical protein [Proteiniphilum sp.]|jgi:uncharacterized membrane protein|uniref:hypothetical protein n=1 Tax=Proteiniphilum sp. TaxID=1926877 RepID=UPI000926D024|nr:hypothetical protein [Dysgonamonadaceae bacterium]OJV90380.1 MAG: hypothetical protein BGO34_07630 [Bacteroidia bacterium 44-10]
MTKKKTILTVIWTIIALIAIAAVISLIVFPRWKGLFLAGSGAFLILNLFLSLFFISKNFKE